MKILALILTVKALINHSAVALVFFVRRARGGVPGANQRFVTVLLILLASVSVVSYFDFGQYPKHGSFLNPHDFFHYYLGAKYWRAVGYRDLYRCVVVADTENHGELRYKTMRSLDTYRKESPRAVMKNARLYRDKFDPKRWEAFKRDVAIIESIAKPDRWLGVVKDKGYNATPVWNMVASFLANEFAPADRPFGLPFLMMLDIMLAVAAAALVYRAFGFHAGTFYVVYFAAHYMMSYPHIRGAFLRLDWVTMLVMATCCIKLKRYGLAGGLTGYAATARIFPAVFVFGMGAKLLQHVGQVWRGRAHYDGRYLRFFTVFGMVVLSLFVASIVHDGGVAHWADFWDKITMHNDDLSPSRVGFKYVFLNTYGNDLDDWNTFEEVKRAEFAQRAWPWRSILAMVLVVVFFVSWRVEDYETLPLGYVLAYFMTAPTFYYHVMLIVPFLLFVPKLHSFRHAMGTALMFGLCVVWYVLSSFYGAGATRLSLSFTISYTLLGLVVYLLVTAVSPTCFVPAGKGVDCRQ